MSTRAGVYTFRFSDGSSYVGSSVDVVRRMRRHMRMMRAGTHENSRVQSCFFRLGVPEFSVLHAGVTPGEVRALEAREIERLTPGLNHYSPTGGLLPTHNKTMRKRMISAFGRTQSLDAWAKEGGVRKNLILLRIDYMGWPAERAVTEPAGERNRRAAEKRRALADAREARKVVV